MPRLGQHIYSTQRFAVNQTHGQHNDPQAVSQRRRRQRDQYAQAGVAQRGADKRGERDEQQEQQQQAACSGTGQVHQHHLPLPLQLNAVALDRR